MIKLLRDLRAMHFPKKLNCGDCIAVCILLGYILKEEYGYTVQLVYGKLGHCYHTWLSVNGIQIDPSTDCAMVIDDRVFVSYVDYREYSISRIESYNVHDFYTDVAPGTLKTLLSQGDSK